MNYSYKTIFLINFPVMMSVLVEQLINITDAIFLGRVGEVELGASAIAGIYYLALYMLGFGFSLGLQVVIARRNGEGHYAETGKTFYQGLWFLMAMAVLWLILSAILSPHLLRYLVSSEEIYLAVMDYLHWRSYGLLFIFPSLAFRAFYVGITQTKSLTANAVAMVATNIVLNWVLIFGNMGMPALGISGAAMASSLSEGVSLLMFIVYTACKLDKKKYGFSVTFNPGILVQVIKISVWSMIHSFLGVAPWLLFFISIEHLGKSQLATANILRSISSVFFVLVNSLASTTASLVSNLVGSGRSGEIGRLIKRIICLGYALGVPLIVLALIFHKTVIGIYTSEANILSMAFVPYVVMLLNYVFALPSYVMLNVVTGLGATRRAFVFQLITVAVYLLYLRLLNTLPGVPLAVYWSVEYVYVISLLIMSWIFIKKRHLPLNQTSENML